MSEELPALRTTFVVACTPAAAFDTWTRRFGSWWPADHTVTGRPDLVSLEPRLGGRIHERGPDGTEHDWGEVTVWEPPHRLGYLWHLRRDRVDATDVEITFREQDGSTLVEIEHRGWERLGADAPVWRERNRDGWSTLLPHFVEFVSAPVPEVERSTHQEVEDG